MTATAKLLADAIVADLAAATFSQAITVSREWYATPSLSGLAASSGVQVLVVPATNPGELATRGSLRVSYGIDIGVLSKLGMGASARDRKAEMDDLIALVEEIRLFLAARQLSTLPSSGWTDDSNEPPFDVRHYLDENQFTSVIRVQYDVYEPLGT